MDSDDLDDIKAGVESLRKATQSIQATQRAVNSKTTIPAHVQAHRLFVCQTRRCSHLVKIDRSEPPCDLDFSSLPPSHAAPSLSASKSDSVESSLNLLVNDL